MGRPARPFVHYAAYPAGPPGPPYTAARGEPLSGVYTTHAFTRSARHVTFESRHGHGPAARPFQDTPTRLPSRTDALMPVHLNLWLQGGAPPHDGQAVEVIVAGFTFEPADGDPARPTARR